MELALRTSVNRWECDENDHMNVRFFLKKHWEAMAAGVSDKTQLGSLVRSHHIRFQKEARLSEPLSGYVGTVRLEDGELRYLTELRQSFSQETISTCLHELTIPNDVRRSDAQIASMPQGAKPRGVQNGTSEFSRVPYSDLEKYGFVLIGKGHIQADECSREGALLPHSYMARLSDSMPHLWGAVHEEGVLDEQEGGAVLEYRLEYFARLSLDDRFEIWSGLRGVGEKLQEFVHLVFNHEGQLAMVAEAVGVRMDLINRKAKRLPPDVLAVMRQKVLGKSGL